MLRKYAPVAYFHASAPVAADSAYTARGSAAQCSLTGRTPGKSLGRRLTAAVIVADEECSARGECG